MGRALTPDLTKPHLRKVIRCDLPPEKRPERTAYRLEGAKTPLERAFEKASWKKAD